MSKGFEELEDVFKDVNKPTNEKNEKLFDNIPQGFEEYKTQKIQPINKDLIDYYTKRPDLLDEDIKSGIIPIDTAKDLKNLIYAYADIESPIPTVNEDGKSNGKQKVKSNSKSLLHESYEIGFAEPLLLGLVVSCIGLLYLGYLYIIV